MMKESNIIKESLLNTLYIVKGSSPMCLLHFETIGLYIYASTESIMMHALRKIGLYNFAFDKIEIVEGDIIRIDKNGEITRSKFEPKIYRSKYIRWYDDYDEYYTNAHEELLLEMCGCFGVDEEDVMLLLDYGYTPDEIEYMLMDYDLINETVKAIKFEEGESYYSGLCEGVI